MILQALKEYYDRKAADPESDIAPEGFERKEIPFLVVIKPDGSFLSLEDTRETVGKKKIGKTFLLPRSQTRTGLRGYETTFLLWDHAGYLFGLAKSKDPKDIDRANNQYKTWIKSLNALPPELKSDKGVGAILQFYGQKSIKSVFDDPLWSECMSLPTCNMTFRLLGDQFPVPCRASVQDYVRKSGVGNAMEDDSLDTVEMFGRCMITGEQGIIARTHGRTSINKDTKSLVAIQKNSGYDSYGKEQCYNAPVCKSVEFAYTTALNSLLKSQRQRIRINETVIVFWAETASELENSIMYFFSEPYTDDPDSNSEAIRSLYDSIWNGTYSIPDSNTRFYILGLSPNSARIAIRFWEVGTVFGIGARLLRHVSDLQIVHNDRNSALPLRRILKSISVLEEENNIPQKLVDDTVHAILTGSQYPQSLIHAVVRRIRAEQSKKDRHTGKSLPNVTYERAAIIKACINRKSRFENPNRQEEIKVSLDPGNMNIGYRLGRLFAILEKIQSDAQGSPNATIRDRYYGAASGTPSTVFGTLMRLKNHHLAKLSDGLRIARERQIADIIGGIADFPPHLKLDDQGRFAIGYYHQMQDLYTKKTTQE